MSKTKTKVTTENIGNTEFMLSEKILCVALSGNFIKCDVSCFLKQAEVIFQKPINKVIFKNNGIIKWDSSLLLLIFQIIGMAKTKGIEYNISELPENLQTLENLAFAVNRKPAHGDDEKMSVLEKIGKRTIELFEKSSNVLSFINGVLKSTGRFFIGKSVTRGCDFLASLQECGPKALAIVMLISFLVGLILAFVGAVQLKEFGAQIYVASLVTIGMCRIMGAIMVGIIMAGRTGSAYAATIGTMQVNEELDALNTMGLSITDFLVLPRVFALVLAMPILTMVADFSGILGGASVGVFMLDIPYQEYLNYSIRAFKLNNFLVGIFHGICFGVIIAICGCYQGVMCGRNADSVGLATTRSVVSAIVAMIVATGIITVICQELEI